MGKIGCTFWGGGHPHAELTEAEIVKLRNEYRGEAHKVLKETGADHVLYYRDERDEHDNIVAAHFYVGPRPYTDEDFCKDVMPYKLGMVGAVHRLGGGE